MTQYGYARVSTDGQDVAMQVAALKKRGVRSVVTETKSGALHLPELEALVRRLGHGDELVVYKVDRLARSLRALLTLQDRLAAAGVTLRSLTEPIDTGTPIGRAFFQLLGVFAELERALIRERCAAGREAAKARGVVIGAVPTVYTEQRIKALAETGLTIYGAAMKAGLCPAHLRRSARRYGVVFFRDPKRSRLARSFE